MYTITTNTTGCTSRSTNKTHASPGELIRLYFDPLPGYSFKTPYNKCYTVTGAGAGWIMGDDGALRLDLDTVTGDMTVSVTATKDADVTIYNIQVNMTGCTAQENNESTIEVNGSTMLRFDAKDGYVFSKPYSSCISITGASLEISDISTDSSIAFIISSPTSNVTVTVTATKNSDDGSYSITIITDGCTSASGNATTIMPGATTWLYFDANDGYYFKEPYKDCYTITGATAGWNIDTGSLGLFISNVTGDVTLKVVATKNAESYKIQVTVSGCEASSDNPTSIVPGGVEELTFALSTGYSFPTDISVECADYIWSKESGKLIVYNPTADVSIIITAVIKEYSITTRLTGCTGSEDNWTSIQHGGGVILSFTVNEGYTFPETVEVTGATTHRWFPDSGRLWVMEAVSDITVTIVATKGGENTVWYNLNGGWIKCYAYYHDGTKWVKCSTYYNNNGTWVKM